VSGRAFATTAPDPAMQNFRVELAAHRVHSHAGICAAFPDKPAKKGGFVNWYLGVLKKYAEFSGRARRKEFWMFALFNIIIAVVLGIVDGFIGMPILGGLYSLAVLLPGIAVGARRLHDIGKSGWWLLIGFVPLIGFIVLIIFFVMDSNPGDNQYGPNPKAA